MKIIISFLTILILVLFGCKEKEKVEVIPDYDQVYLPLNKVDKTPQLIDGDEKELSDKINQEIEKSSNNDNVLLDYKILLDEKGNVDKIQVVKSPADKFNKLVADEIKNWKFEPAYKGDEPVKSQYRWKFKNGVITNITELNSDEFVVTADLMPMPVGGLFAIQEKIVYPEIAKRAGIEGKVFVTAYIDTTGKVVKTEILKGIGSGLDEAAINAINQTKFTPGKVDNKKVKTKITIPIIFRLQ